MVDDVRRRRCAPVVTWVEEGEARMMSWQREEKLASSLGRSEYDVAKMIAYVNVGGRITERVGAKSLEIKL